ncbi:hypothetical protein GPECTOR_1g364 [Gonium pectorale]|uniref:CDT1 Geminin-binding domain-containing protein n=1 Tax=Gonium pectorale TaxID=33097 RepID=A0A150H2L7_GONPE|nr:hypothetical protein GPECTOR_1g364 [Gonium pectorale]|eukprot:KXZ56409.1 hypothetical protein GPECTOR_1g364 [Gonium pectorale]
MFDALHTGRMMLKRRSERVTYNSVRQVVENITKREFRVEHLAQMKHLMPDAFDWQYIRTPSATHPQQLETQLLVTFDRPLASGADGGSVGRYSSSAVLAEFRSALEEWARQNPMDPETGKVPSVPQAPLPPRPAAAGATPSRSASLPLGGLASPASKAAASPGGAAGLQTAASCPPGLLPGFQVPSSPGGSNVSGASPSMTRTRSRLGLPSGAAPPGLTPIPEGTPTRHATAAREAGAGADIALEDDDEDALAGGSGAVAVLPGLELTQQQQPENSVATSARRQGGSVAGPSCAGAATPQSKGPRPAALQRTPTSQARDADPRLARLHSLLSPAALLKIREVEATQAAQTPEAKRRAEMRRAVQLLPHAYDLVRLVFGISGPTVKPLTQVAQLMCERSTQKQGLTSRDASNTLVALARAVPEYIRIEDPRVMADGSTRPRSAVISRTANINAVGAKLKALAADPDAGMEAIFGRGCGVAVAVAALASPSASGAVTAGAAAGGDSPVAARLQPRALAQSLDDESSGVARAGSASFSGVSSAPTAGDMPPPPPSARKRPPGLPLPPPSPQEAMLNSIRRSSAKRSCQQRLGDVAGAGESDEEEAAEENAKPRRLEELLGD